MDIELMKKLSLTFGPSGNEAEIRSLIKKLMKPYVDEIFVDKYGNLVCHKKGTGPKLLLAAHLDEIGLMIKGIDPSGDIRCSPIGGIEPVNVIGERVTLMTNKGEIRGVVTTSHISNNEVLTEAPAMKDVHIDTGLTKQELEKRGVEAGQYLNLERYFVTLGSSQYICGKAMDDRVGCYILVELARRLRKVKQEIYYVFTVQEEVGLYGAKTSIYGIDPDYAIVVDVTNADDKQPNPTKSLGNGPCLTIKDADMLSNRCVDDWIKAAAKRKKIPLQLDVSDEGTTDALTISISKGGIPSTVLGVALRNLHTTISIAHTQDIEYCIQLLEEVLKNTPHYCKEV